MRLTKIILSLFFLSFSFFAYAYDLDGYMTPTGDGTYTVFLQNSFGRKFYGHAEDQGDGQYNVTVTNSSGQMFEGYALDNQDGGYVLNLESDATGEMATGTLEKRY